MKHSTRSRSRHALSALCLLLGLVFVGGGIVKFIPIDFEVRNFAHFGYAPWFMTLIGVLELGGGLMLIWRPLRLLASLGLAIVMVGAATSHLRAGDGIGMATPALVFFGLLLVVAIAYRHQWRILPLFRPARQLG